MKTRRRAVSLLVAAAIGYLGYGIWHAGLNEIGAPSHGPSSSVFSNGSINGERTGSHGWSVSYDKLVASPDQRTLDLTGVHDGKVYVRGKPALRLRADHAVLDTVTHDFSATGHLRIESLDARLPVVLETDRATWSNDVKRLVLPDPIVMHRAGTTTVIGRAELDVARSELHLRGSRAGRSL